MNNRKKLKKKLIKKFEARVNSKFGINLVDEKGKEKEIEENDDSVDAYDEIDLYSSDENQDQFVDQTKMKFVTDSQSDVTVQKSKPEHVSQGGIFFGKTQKPYLTDHYINTNAIVEEFVDDVEMLLKQDFDQNTSKRQGAQINISLYKSEYSESILSALDHELCAALRTGEDKYFEFVKLIINEQPLDWKNTYYLSRQKAEKKFFTSLNGYLLCIGLMEICIIVKKVIEADEWENNKHYINANSFLKYITYKIYKSNGIDIKHRQFFLIKCSPLLKAIIWRFII